MVRWLSTLALVGSLFAALALLAACGDNRPGSAASLAIDPAASSVPAGRDLVLHVEYLDDDGQPATGEALTWTSSAPVVASVVAAPGGAIVHAFAIGSAVITARVGELEEAALISVREGEVDALVIDPPQLDLPDGTCATMVAIATLSDGTTGPIDGTRVLWGSSTGLLAVGGDGTICESGHGPDVLRARYGGQDATAAVNGIDGIPIVLEVFGPSDLALGSSGQAVAFVQMSDGLFTEVTELAGWSTQDPAIATVSSSGLVTAVAVGATVVQATFGSFTAASPLRVFEVTMTELFITPSMVVLGVDEARPVGAIAAYSDGSFVDVSDLATWTSSDTAVAIYDHGDVIGVAPGSATITATMPGFASSTMVSVSP